MPNPSIQQHKIMRQVIEVNGCEPGSAKRVQSLIRDTYFQQLLPLIETICSDLSDPSQIHRIDHLEIEIDELAIDTLESALAEPFEEAFRDKLAAAISASPQVDADLELFDYFVRTGSVPWWTNPGEPALLEANMQRLIQRQPRSLRRLLQDSPELTLVQRRVARAYPDHLLDRLISVLAPSLFTDNSSTANDTTFGVGAAWLTLIEPLGSSWGHTKTSVRHLFWEEILREAGSAENTPRSAASRFYQALLTRVARRLGRDYPELINDLHQALSTAAIAVPDQVRVITDLLWQSPDRESSPARHTKDTISPDSNLQAESIRAELIDILAQIEQSSIPDLQFLTRLRAVLERLPEPMKASALAAFDTASGNANARMEAPGKLTTTVLETWDVGSSADNRSPDAQALLIALIQKALAQATLADADSQQTLFEKRKDKRSNQTNTLTESAQAELMDILTRLEQSLVLDNRLWTQLRATLEKFPEALKMQAITAFESAIDIARMHGNTGAGVATDNPVQDMPVQEDLGRDRLNNKSEQSSKDVLISLLRSTLEQLPNEKIQRQVTPVTSSFSEVEALYVGNAGLVILWPFLLQFFDRLELISDKQFKSEADAQRAVGLLQYLASTDESPSEILLPLNKVLCGIEPEAVFDFGVAISLQEKQECDDLLAAVIQQAPILHAMSSDGFRGSFLLRQGQLGVRDGQWLLRVERETHDIVLDRFPWGVSIVRLPWMKAMMQVEW